MIDLRGGRCSCGHGETASTTLEVVVDGVRARVLGVGGVALELWACASCGLAHLAVSDVAKLHGRPAVRRVFAEEPGGEFAVRLMVAVSEGAERVTIESRVAEILHLDVMTAARLLDAPVGTDLTRSMRWNEAESIRARLAAVGVMTDVVAGKIAGYR